MHETVRELEDQEVDKSCFLGLLGKAFLRTGQLDKASEAVRQGLDQSNKIGEHYYTAELLRLRGEAEARRGNDPKVAEAPFRRSDRICTGTGRTKLGAECNREPVEISDGTATSQRGPIGVGTPTDRHLT